MTAAKKKPRGGNPRASQNIIPFRPGNRDMAKNTAAVTMAQADAFEFGAVPLVHGPIYRVDPSVPVRYLLNEAAHLVGALVEVAGEGVEGGISGPAAWLMETNLARLQALIGAVRSGMPAAP